MPRSFSYSTARRPSAYTIPIERQFRVGQAFLPVPLVCFEWCTATGKNACSTRLALAANR